jgi:hypothetical protein
MTPSSVLVAMVTAAAIVLLRRELLAALRDPSPAGSIFLISAGYLAGAALVVCRDGSEASVFVYSAYALHFSMFTIGYFTLTRALGLRDRPTGFLPTRRDLDSGGLTKWLFFLLAAGAATAAMFATGEQKLLAALYRFALFGDLDISVLQLRLGFASGEERWIAPGYLKQLRDVLLPLATLLILFSVRRRPVGFVVMSIVSIVVISVLMISSGERAPVLLFLLGAFYAAFKAVRWNLQSLRAVVVPIVLMAAIGAGTFLALTSSFTSRYEEGASIAGVLVDRIITRAPEENVFGAPVWSRGAPFPGAGWISELSSVLPGTQKTLSNLIHEYLGGGDIGNSVLGAWVDVQYNFGWSLGIAVSVLVGFVVALFNHWVNSCRTVSGEADLCGLWLSICMLLVLSPFGFLLYGPFTLSACLALIVATRTRVPMQRERL